MKFPERAGATDVVIVSRCKPLASGEREKAGEKERESGSTYLEEGDIVIDREGIVSGVSDDSFNLIIVARVFVVISCIEFVNVGWPAVTKQGNVNACKARYI